MANWQPIGIAPDEEGTVLDLGGMCREELDWLRIPQCSLIWSDVTNELEWHDEQRRIVRGYAKITHFMPIPDAPCEYTDGGCLEMHCDE